MKRSCSVAFCTVVISCIVVADMIHRSICYELE